MESWDKRPQITGVCTVLCRSCRSHKISWGAICAVSFLGKGERWGGSHCSVLVQSSSRSWVGAKSFLKVMGTPASHTDPPSSLKLVLWCFTTGKLHQCPPELWGTTGTAPGDVCWLAVCLSAERGGTRVAREQLSRNRERPLGRHLGEEETRSPELAWTLKVKQGQVKQGAWTGGRSLQGSLSTVTSCKGRELAASDSLTEPSQRRGSKGHSPTAQIPRHAPKNPCCLFTPGLRLAVLSCVQQVNSQ